MHLNLKNTSIIIILLNVLIAFVVLSLPFKAKFYGDIVFHEEAKIFASIINGDKGLSELELKRAPAPSIFYGVAYSFVKENNDRSYWKAGVISNMLLICLSSLFIIASYIKLCGNKFLWLPITILLIIPVQLYYGMGIIAESLAFFATSIITYGFVSLIQKPTTSSKLTIGIGMLIFVFARPNAVLILVLPLVLTAILFIIDKKKYKNFLINTNLITLVTISTFIIFTKIIKSIPTNQNKTNQENLFLLVCHHGRFQFRTEEFDWRFWDNENRADSKDYISYVDCLNTLNKKIVEEKRTYKEVYQEWLIGDILGNPLIFLKQASVRVIYGNVLQINSVDYTKFSISGINGKFIYYLFHVLLNLVNFGLIIFSIMGLIKLQKIKKEYVILIVPYLALIFFHMFIYMEQRYLFPARNIIILLASYSISDLIEKYKIARSKSNYIE